MRITDYHQKIIDYYRVTEHAYRDSWDLDNSLAIHYGYWDEQVRSFAESLARMNEVMIHAAGIGQDDRVLDAGCGIGGSSIYIAGKVGAQVVGISLSERQVEQATQQACLKKMNELVSFKVMNYSVTDFPDASFDVVWGCESICYADDKAAFIREAYRLLKPGGRLVVADGFVSEWEYNEHPAVRQWLDGWQVNFLETPSRFSAALEQAGFNHIAYRDISPFTAASSKRLYRIYFLARLYLYWRKISFSKPVHALQVGNINACKHQYLAMKKGLWQYGLIVGKKE